MHRFLTRSRLAAALTTAAATLALLAPTSAHAILVGIESNGLLVNSTATPAIQAQELDRAVAQGVKVVRANFGWSEIAANCAGTTPVQQANHLTGCYNWAILDSLVKLTNERKIQLMLSTSGVPNWVQPKGCVGAVGRCYHMGTTQAEFNKTYLAYGAFLKAAGTRYKAGSPYGTVKYWTIWNEPNSDTFWKPNGNAARYAQMVGYAAQQLKAAHKSAQIAVGPTAPKGHAAPKNSGPIATAMKPGNYIKAFQASLPKFLKKRGVITAWAHNPYPLAIRAQPSKPVATIKMPIIGMNNLPDLFTLLDSKPLTKGLPVWATEFGWETLPDENGPVWGIPRQLQSQYVGESFDRLSRLKRVPIGIWYGLTDGPLAPNPDAPGNTLDWQSGTFTNAGVAKPSFYMFQRPISVPTGLVKKGTSVAVWGKSNLKPSKGRLVWCTVACTTKKAKWHWVTGVKKGKDGDLSAMFRITKPKTYFSVYDGELGVSEGYGSLRLVVAK